MNRLLESKEINNSFHLLQLVVFGVLHCSCYGVSFGSRYEFIQMKETLSILTKAHNCSPISYCI